MLLQHLQFRGVRDGSHEQDAIGKQDNRRNKRYNQQSEKGNQDGFQARHFIVVLLSIVNCHGVEEKRRGHCQSHSLVGACGLRTAKKEPLDFGKFWDKGIRSL